MKRSLPITLLLPLALAVGAAADAQDPPTERPRAQRQQDGGAQRKQAQRRQDAAGQEEQAQRRQDAAGQGEQAGGRKNRKAQGGEGQARTATRPDPNQQGKAGARIDATVIQERARAARADMAASKEAQQRAKERRLVTRNFFGEVKQHHVRRAQLDRLEAIFAEQGEDGKVARVQALREQEQGAWVKILARYRNEMGDEHFNAFRKRVGALLQESEK